MASRCIYDMMDFKGIIHPNYEETWKQLMKQSIPDAARLRGQTRWNPQALLEARDALKRPRQRPPSAATRKMSKRERDRAEKARYFKTIWFEEMSEFETANTNTPRKGRTENGK